LTEFDDDAIVVVHSRRDAWVAEFNGPFRITVTDAKLERCRHLAITALDERLLAYVLGSMAQGVLSSSKTRSKRVKS